MRSVRHDALARKRRNQAIALSLVGVAVLIVGLVLNFQLRYGAAYVALITGTIISWIGVVLTDRWVSIPRPDKTLDEALDSVTGRVYALYHWSLPAAGHVLLAPWGLTVLFVHNHDGPAHIDGDRWRDRRALWKRLTRFARRPLRHPGKLLELELESLREALAEAEPSLADTPIDAAVLFSHPAAHIEVESSDLPILTPDELPTWIRRSLKAKPRLAPADRLKLEQTLDAMAEERMGRQ